MSALSIPEVGQLIHGFRVKKVWPIRHLDVTAVSLEHEKTKADYLHLARDDPNNLFTVGFKTMSPDETGIPHVLEHYVLCGSEKFPVHDPFFRMVSRSLYTFMNAETSMDYTVYPISSTVPKGYRNLIDVYLDAVYHPLLRESDFGKECWHLAPKNEAKADLDLSVPPADRLQIKGVVYNEMKGHLGNAEYRFMCHWLQQLFPESKMSGGDPLHIPELGYQTLREYHEHHYHPSNSRILTYGNLPLTDNLEQIGKVLDQFEYREFDIPNMKLVELNGPKVVPSIGPLDPLMDKDCQHRISLTWHAGSSHDYDAAFALHILVGLLTSGYSAPLYKALIESGIGQQFSLDTGYETLSSTSTVTLGAFGVRVENLDKVRSIIEETLHTVSETGFDPEKIEGELHQVELRSRIKSDRFGMQIRQRIMGPWINGIDLLSGPQLDDIISSFRERVKTGGYLEGIIKKYMLTDNVLILTMAPSETDREEWDQKEKESIERQFKQFSANYPSEEAAYKAVVELDTRLDEESVAHKHEDLSSLPSLDMSDLPLEPPNLKPIRNETVDGHEVFVRETGTSGVTYFRAVNPVEGLTPELRKFIPLFSDAIFRLDTKSLTVKELETQRRLFSGDIGISFFVDTDPVDNMKAEQAFRYSGYTLTTNIARSLNLLYTIISEVDFDNANAEAKLKELITSSAASSTGDVTHSGTSYAQRLANSRFSPTAKITEELYGVTNMQLMSELAQRESLDDVIETLKVIQKVVLTNFGNMRTLIITEAESVKKVQESIVEFLAKFKKPTGDLPLTGTTEFTPSPGKDFIVSPGGTSFCVSIMPTVPFSHEDSPKLRIMGSLVSDKHLLHAIRVVGSAYGGGMSVRSDIGTISSFSYRDPTPLSSLQLFDETGKWVEEHDITEEELTEAKLSLFSMVDAPISISNEGVDEFESKTTADMTRERRKRLLNATLADMKYVGKKYFTDPSKAGRCVLGPKSVLPADQTGWNVIELKLDAASPDEAE